MDGSIRVRAHDGERQRPNLKGSDDQEIIRWHFGSETNAVQIYVSAG